MSYRINEHKKDTHPSVDKFAPRTIVTLVNGSSARMAFPCFYVNPLPPKHCEHWHDHIGWPSPNHPDHICQLPTMQGWHEIWHDDKHWTPGTPIHFLREGYYEQGSVSFFPEVPGLEAEAYIDPMQDWVVMLNISAHTPHGIDKPKRVKCLVTIDNGDKEDVVANGYVIILPSGWDGE